MPTLYYRDGLATGGDTGVDAANAFQTFTSMAAGISAGDTVLWYPSTITQGADGLLSTAGTITSPIIHIGVNTSWVVEEGQGPTVDGVNSWAPMRPSGAFQRFENITAINGSTYCWNCSNRITLVNCDVDTSTNHGFYLNSNCNILRSRVTNCTNGIYLQGNYNTVDLCTPYGNSGHGIYGNGIINTATRNLVFDNGTGLRATNYGTYYLNIFDANTLGVDVVSGTLPLVFNYNILTNNTTGMALASSGCSYYRNIWWNNGTKQTGSTYYLPFDSTVSDTDLSANPWTNQPGTAWDYTSDVTNTDMNQVAVILDSLNTSYMYMGAVNPSAPTATTPTFSGATYAEPNSKGGIEITWSAGSDVTYYEVYISTSALTWNVSEITHSVYFGTNTASVYADASGNALVDDTLYYIGVRALSVGTQARDANVVELTTAPQGTSAKFIIRQTPGGARQ